MLVAKPYLIVFMPWERSRRQENGYHIIWTTDKWKSEKRCVKCCFLGMKESLSCIGYWLETKNGSTSRTQNARSRGLTQDNHPHRPQNRIASEGRQCCAFGGIRRVWCTMSFWNQVKLWIPFATVNNWSIWTMHWSKSAQIGLQDTEKWYWSKTTPHHTQRKTSESPFLHLARNSCPTRRTHQTWPLRTTTCFDRYRKMACWLDHLKMWTIFSERTSTIWRTDEQNV